MGTTDVALRASLTTPRRRKHVSTIEERAVRLACQSYAGRQALDILAWYNKVWRDESEPIFIRMSMAEKLLTRGIGVPAQIIEEQGDHTVKHIYEVRWLPPDPNDRSKLIEPEK